MDFCEKNDAIPNLPYEIDQMIKHTEILARDFLHVRVDFYNVNVSVFFGELTFLTGADMFLLCRMNMTLNWEGHS